MDARTSIHECKSGAILIHVYRHNNELEADVTSPTEGVMKLESRQIKCGIEKITPHSSFLQKIEGIAKEKIKDVIALVISPSEGKTEEVWMFEATSMAVPWIKKAKNNLEGIDSIDNQKGIDSYRSALKNFETALKMQENKKGQTQELQAVIDKLKKDLSSQVLKNIVLDAANCLPSQEDVDAFAEIVEAYNEEEDMLTCLSDHLEACKSDLPSTLQHYLAACIHEGKNELVLAGEDYINLSKEIKSSGHINHCVAKAESLMGKNASQQVREQKSSSYETLILQAEQCLNEAKSKPSFEEAKEKYHTALKFYQTALKLCQDVKKQFEIRMNIQAIKKKLFLEKTTPNELKRFLPVEEHQQGFLEILEMYQEYDDIFSPLLEIGQCEILPKRKPHDHFMCAWAYEATDQPVPAAENYLWLARQKNVDSVFCLKHALSLFDDADAISFAHFLENIDRAWLKKLVANSNDNTAKKTLLQKDAVRMTFEKYLGIINSESEQKKKPTSYICFTFERGVSEWLEHIFIPDLYKIGIQPIFCLEQLGPGKDLNEFQAKIRSSDQVIVICTPLLKKICDTRKEAITGVAMEIRLMIERYNDANKHDTIYPIYLKGERNIACPTVFIEGVLGSKIPPIGEEKKGDTLAYYSTIFELFGAMRGIERQETRNDIKANFLREVDEIIEKTRKDCYDEQLVEKWREKNIPKDIQEMIISSTAISNPSQTTNDIRSKKSVSVKKSIQPGEREITKKPSFDDLAKTRYTQQKIARDLWLDPEALISDDIVEKVNFIADYLKEQGFALKGARADGDCFCHAYMVSYESSTSQKVSLLNQETDKIKYLREWISIQFANTLEGANKPSRVQEIKTKENWIAASGEGDLLATALAIPIRLISAEKNINNGTFQISDTLTFQEKDKPRQDWNTIIDSEKPIECIIIVGFGGHFVGVRPVFNENFYNKK